MLKYLTLQRGKKTRETRDVMLSVHPSDTGSYAAGPINILLNYIVILTSSQLLLQAASYCGNMVRLALLASEHGSVGVKSTYRKISCLINAFQ
jgi:hypothetical protein